MWHLLIQAENSYQTAFEGKRYNTMSTSIKILVSYM